MSLSIVGWVELKNETLNKWYAIIKIDNLLENDYTAYGYIFGVWSQAVADPIAPKRGLPNDISREARYELDSEGYIHHSWVTWEEINASGWQNKGFADGWWLLLEMMRLSADNYGNNNVRLVVAFV